MSRLPAPPAREAVCSLLGVAGEVRVMWLDVSMFECPMGALVVVVGVAGRGGLRWWRGTRVVVVRCVLAETAVGRSKT